MVVDDEDGEFRTASQRKGTGSARGGVARGARAGGRGRGAKTEAVVRPLSVPSARLRGLAQYSNNKRLAPSLPRASVSNNSAIADKLQKGKQQPPSKKQKVAAAPTDHFGMALGPVPQLELAAQPLSYLRLLVGAFVKTRPAIRPPEASVTQSVSA